MGELAFPVIDIGVADTDAVHRQVDVACREWGFFQVVGHGIAPRTIEALFGFEKSILAIVLGVKALTREPAPALDARRSWARSGIALGVAQAALVVTIILLNLDRIPKLIEAFRALSDGL